MSKLISSAEHYGALRLTERCSMLMIVIVLFIMFMIVITTAIKMVQEVGYMWLMLFVLVHQG